MQLAIEHWKISALVCMSNAEQVFDFGTSNQEIYEDQCAAIVQSVVDGYNGTVFLYGQTKSGMVQFY